MTPLEIHAALSDVNKLLATAETIEKIHATNEHATSVINCIIQLHNSSKDTGFRSLFRTRSLLTRSNSTMIVDSIISSIPYSRQLELAIKTTKLSFSVSSSQSLLNLNTLIAAGPNAQRVATQLYQASRSDQLTGTQADITRQNILLRAAQPRPFVSAPFTFQPLSPPVSSVDIKSQTCKNKLVVAEAIKLKLISEEEIPEDFLCQISYSIMDDPVFNPKNTAENSPRWQSTIIADWLSRSNSTDPITREKLTTSELLTDTALKAKITSFIEDLESKIKALKESQQDKPARRISSS